MHKSRIYSFLDNKQGFVWHFFEGQRVIADLATQHSLQGAGFTYYRDLVLSSVPMIKFLKSGEQFGLYIDSEDPYFKFKIEAGHSGQFRTLILPKNFSLFPDKIDGIGRFSKVLPNGVPYNSIIELQKTPSAEIVNKVIKNSYQTDAKTILSEMTDQALLIVRLPDINPNLENKNTNLETYKKQKKSIIHDLFENDFNNIEDIVNFLETKELAYLSSKEIDFFCGCSHQNMVEGLSKLSLIDKDELFNKKDTIDVSCDYCNKNYQVTADQLN